MNVFINGCYLLREIITEEDNFTLSLYGISEIHVHSNCRISFRKRDSSSYINGKDLFDTISSEAKIGILFAWKTYYAKSDRSVLSFMTLLEQRMLSHAKFLGFNILDF